MTSRPLPVARLAVPAYLALLLVLAALGATNQGLYRTQLRLMDAKEELATELAATRRLAAQVAGPSAVATWAAERGMVPVPEARDTLDWIGLNYYYRFQVSFHPLYPHQVFLRQTPPRDGIRGPGDTGEIWPEGLLEHAQQIGLSVVAITAPPCHS